MNKKALVLVDFQNDYFPSFSGAKFALVDTEKSVLKAAELLKVFRTKNLEVIHIRHEKDSEDAPFFKKGSIGAKIHESVIPLKNEKVITKNFPNSFLNTDLKAYLENKQINTLVIVGAMSHMCIDATVRAASDFGYNCIVAKDACATKDLENDGVIVSSNFVHLAFMSALEFAYAKVLDTDKILKEI